MQRRLGLDVTAASSFVAAAPELGESWDTKGDPPGMSSLCMVAAYSPRRKRCAECIQNQKSRAPRDLGDGHRVGVA